MRRPAGSGRYSSRAKAGGPRAGRGGPTRGPAHRRRRGLLLAAVAAVLLILALSGVFSGGKAGRAAGAGSSIRSVSVSGVIDSATAGFIIRNLTEAENEQARAVVIILDTSGGLDGPVRDVIRKMTASPLPVAAYIAPSEGRAVGSGALIAMGADIAAMAPGAILGPVNQTVFGADPDSSEGKKIAEGAAYIRSLAEAAGRNANWAELAVRQPVTLSADEALERQVIDLKADNLDALIAQLDGFHAKAKNLDLQTGDYDTLTNSRMNIKEVFSHALASPNLAYFFFIGGLLAASYALARPGIGVRFAVIGGAASLLFSFFCLLLLPVSLAGLTLLTASMALLGLRFFKTGHAAISAAGLIAFIPGSFFLFNESFLRVSPLLTLGLGALTGSFFLLAAPRMARARRPSNSGRQAMIGETGLSRTTLDPLGQVFVRGEIWSAEAPEDEIIEKGEEIEVVGVKGLILRVRRTA